ncbi:hypothetical protein PENTCL1PPCAC_20032 [Pristionchus entomophagus]|uniref:PAP-associated domain-containing protein n=1 Tax=Pristionchus entomophagus TaxID=358040 RepID=A0AAV5TTS8_9BILA|nr:hypothetical protein PENTCL1PPCAC_20032 [Pristionchus entomophagus]
MNLLIHFLQCGVSPPILPSLIRFHPHLDPRQYLKYDLPEPIQTENTQSMASLLFGFFTYYSQFDFENQAISITAGNIYKRGVVDKESSKKMIISNPYYNANSNADLASHVHYASFRASCKKSLESLTSSFKLFSLPCL